MRRGGDRDPPYSTLDSTGVTFKLCRRGQLNFAATLKHRGIYHTEKLFKGGSHVSIALHDRRRLSLQVSVRSGPRNQKILENFNVSSPPERRAFLRFAPGRRYHENRGRFDVTVPRRSI